MPTEKPTGRPSRISIAPQLRGLKPDTKPYEVSDAKAAGLRLRVQPSGARTWWYVYREAGTRSAPGKVHRIKLGSYPTLSLANARTAREAWAAQRGADGADDPHEVLALREREEAAQAAQEAADVARGVWTVRRLGGAYLDALRATKRRQRTVVEIARQFEHDVYPAIGGMAADEVTLGDVERLLAAVAKRGSTRQRNAIRTTLVGMYSWATGTRRRTLAADGPEHLRGGANPAAAVAVIDHRPTRERRAYAEAELRGLWKALCAARGDLYADALALLTLCGTRASETVSARWRDVDLDAGTWTISGTVTKNRQAHRVVFPAQARELLQARHDAGTGKGYVFPLRDAADGHARADTLRHRLTEILGELGLDQTLTAHELRHSFLTAVVGRFRFAQEVRRRVANHVSGDALERVYIHHSYDEEARQAWARWGTYLDGLLTATKVVALRPGTGS